MFRVLPPFSPYTKRLESNKAADVNNPITITASTSISQPTLAAESKSRLHTNKTFNLYCIMSWVTVGAHVCILIAPCSYLQPTEVNQAVSCSLVTLKPWAQTASTASRIKHGSLNVPIEHHPTIRYMVYNGYYKMMSNIPKMGHLPTPGLGWLKMPNSLTLQLWHFNGFNIQTPIGFVSTTFSQQVHRDGPQSCLPSPGLLGQAWSFMQVLHRLHCGWSRVRAICAF